MQTAFARLGLLPPPAAGAMTFTRRGGTRAGCAANARVAAIMQRVVGQLLGADIGPDITVGPVEQWTDLLQAVLLVARDRLRRGTQIGLLAPHARDPGPVAGDGATEGLDFANLAATQARTQVV